MYFSPSVMGFFCVEVHGDAMPDDVVAISNELYQSLQGWAIQVVDGLPARLPAPPVDPTPALVAAVQTALDDGARSRNYDDIATAITYRGDPNPKFAAEAEVFFAWRSAAWTKAYEILAEVQTGNREFPTIPEALALLPALVLPDSNG
ncbi:hypothetical protein QTI51_09640 [Variovorax sp. J22G73]|nr:hypothetical protein [Variovorax sp. J22R203]MDM0097539.1 hypothetical protein [Variovorax sp. J22G73]